MAERSPVPGSEKDARIALQAVASGLVRHDQLQAALDQQARETAAGAPRPLAEVLLQSGSISLDDLNAILDRLEASPPSNPTEVQTAVRSLESESGLATPGVREAPRRAALGKYRILRELGRGGMGVVYEALDERLDRKVALKLMLTAPHADPQMLAQEEERFVREAQLAAKLKHPNIVAVYDAGVLEGQRYQAMELVEGVGFNLWRATVPMRRQVELLRDAALAVDYAHAQGILHRDLKPANLLVDAQGKPYLTDFGLAKAVTGPSNISITGSGVLVGTPAYMSPEQAQGDKGADRRSDVYSLGVMLYEVLAGQLPFRGDSPIDTLVKVVKDPVPLPSRVMKPGAGLVVDRQIENICLKALAKDREERYPSAAALAGDLGKWLKGEEVKVVPPRPKRNWTWAYVAAGVVVLVTVVIGFIISHYRSLEEEHLRNRDAAKADTDRIRREAEEKALVDASAAEAERERLEAERREADERLRQAEERLRAAGIQQPGSFASTLPPEAAWTAALDLLPLVSVGSDSVGGLWSLKDGKLFSDAARHARIEIPYQPPGEYDLRVSFTRMAGSGDVNLVLSRNGKPFVWMMGGYENRVFGFEMIRGKYAEENPSTVRRASCLENGKEHTVVLQVRKAEVKAYLDGQPLSRLEAADADLGIHPYWTLRSGAFIGVGSYMSPVTFHRVQLLEVGGKGAAVARPGFTPLKAVAPSPAALAPGLVAEVHAGKLLDALLLRKLDPAVNNRWGKGPAFEGGPADTFSCRWTGFLRVPKTGTYTLQAASDDGMRLSLGGQEVLGNWTHHAEAANAVTLALEEGFHSLVLEHFENHLDATMTLAWSSDAARKPSPIGPEHFFHDPAAFTPFTAADAQKGLVRTLHGHDGGAWCVAFSPDGELLATGGSDKTLRLWMASTGEPVRTLGGHAGTVVAAAFSPDGKTIVTGGGENAVILWDVASGRIRAKCAGHTARVTSVAFSPDGATALSGSWDKQVILWDATTGRKLRAYAGHENRVHSVAYGPDRASLLSGAWDRAMILWEMETGRRVRTFTGHAERVQAVAFSADGKTIASGARDRLVKTWDTATGAEIRTFSGHQAEVMSVAFSPDGTRLVSAGNDQSVRLWDAATGKELRVFSGHLGSVEHVAFSPDGTRVASASSDRTVRLWNTGD